MARIEKEESTTALKEETAKTDNGFATGDDFKGTELATNVHLQSPSPRTQDPGDAAVACEQHARVTATRQQPSCSDEDPTSILGQRTSKCPSEQKQPATGRLVQRDRGIIAQSTTPPRAFRIARVGLSAFTGVFLKSTTDGTPSNPRSAHRRGQILTSSRWPTTPPR